MYKEGVSTEHARWTRLYNIQLNLVSSIIIVTVYTPKLCS